MIHVFHFMIPMVAMSKRLYKTAFFLLTIFVLVTPGHAQAATDPVATLRQQLMGNGGAATLQIGGVHATAKALVRPIDNRIVNGAIQSRAMDMLRGSGDTVLRPGETVRINGVEATSDSKNDYLRITAVTSANATALLAFAVPKGALGGMSDAQLNQLVSPVLKSAGLAASEENFSGSTSARPNSNSGSAVASTNVAASPAASAQVEARVTEPTDGIPRTGVWTNVGKIYPHDLSDDAGTAGTYNLNAENRAEPATVFIACDGRNAQAPKLILRVAVPIFQGFRPSDGTTGTLFVGSQKRTAPFSSVSGGQLIFLELELSPAEINVLASEDEVEVRGISYSFMFGALRANITASLPPATASLTTALQACRIQLPPHSQSPMAAVAANQVQHLELAKIALGMSADQVRSALGPAFRFVPQPDPHFPRLSYLAAIGNDEAYAVTMVDGQVQGFNYFKEFAPGGEPLQKNLIDGVTAKAWQPIFVRPPYRMIWVTDEQGRAITKPLPDIVISPCAGIDELPFGAVGQGSDSPQARNLKRVSPRDNGATCGVTIRMNIVPSQKDNALAQGVSLSVANDVAFHSFVRGVNQVQQQNLNEQHRKADAVKNPF
jgi:hypothetical protein